MTFMAEFKRRFNLFFKNLQKDALLFFFLLILFTIFRVIFLAAFRRDLEGAGLPDILMTLAYGLRLGMKTAGAYTVPCFVICTIILSVFKIELPRLRKALSFLSITLVSLLFQFRIPYYAEFKISFDSFIFNTFYDDVGAIFDTAVKSYNAPVRVLAGIATAVFACWVFNKILKLPAFKWPEIKNKTADIILRLLLIFMLAPMAVFFRFGGALSYSNSFSWKTAVKFKQHLLNEAILDDTQAMYRANYFYREIKSAARLNITPEELRAALKYISGGQKDYEDVYSYLEKSAPGAKIKKPTHIFVILAETYMSWPLLKEYKDLHIADGVKGIAAEKNAFSTLQFLPSGNGTMKAVNSVVLGLPELSLQTNLQKNSLTGEPYKTSMAPQFERLGYTTNFWYGGYHSWQKIRSFILAQGFDNFYSAGDFPGKPHNVWGMEDRYFLQSIEETFDADGPSLNVILTTSNHPPYTVDLQKENFNYAAASAALPEAARKDKAALEKLGNFWYADKYIAAFVRDMYKKYPDSIFIVMGDHSERWTLSASPSILERYGVPFVIFGQGINKDLFPADASGGFINITPTLLELIAPKSFKYYSLAPSMLAADTPGLHPDAWVLGPDFGLFKDGGTPEQLKETHSAYGAAAGWLITKSPDIRPAVRTELKNN